MIYKVTYNYANALGQLRNGGLVLEAKDTVSAETEAIKQLSERYKIFNIANVTKFELPTVRK